MPRAGLDPSIITAAAATLIDEQGADALTLKSVAAAVGVRPPSLYAHIESLEDLRERLGVFAAEQLGDAIAPAAAGLARGDAIRAVGCAYRTWVLEHPGLYAILEPNGPRGEPAVERVLEIVLAVLRGYGLEHEQAIHAARTLRASLHGFTALEAGGGFGIPVDIDASFEWMLAALDHGIAAGPKA